MAPIFNFVTQFVILLWRNFICVKIPNEPNLCGQEGLHCDGILFVIEIDLKGILSLRRSTMASIFEMVYETIGYWLTPGRYCCDLKTNLRSSLRNT